MTDESITLKVYPVTAKSDGTGVIQHFHPQTVARAGSPISILNSNSRDKHKLIFLWATKLPSAASTIPRGEASYRMQVINAYMTRCVPSFDDKIKSSEVTFKWVPFNKSGSANKKEESCTSTSTASLTTVTTSATSF